MGSAKIVLPEGVPCRIEGADAGFLASVDIHGGTWTEFPMMCTSRRILTRRRCG